MRAKIIAAVAAAVFVCLAIPVLSLQFTPRCTDKVSLEYIGDQKPSIVEKPVVQLTADEKDGMYAGKVVTRMLDAEHGLKMGWMRFIVDADPVSVWNVIADVDHFAMEDPAFPATGPIGDKKRTFMPYVRECLRCEIDGKPYLYQLLVMPLVSPRATAMLRCHDLNGFPWESGWQAAPGKYCMDKSSPDVKKYLDEAVVIAKNTGAWRVSALSPEFRRKASDLNRTEVNYIVDTDPGGSVGKMTGLANAAQGIALPKLAELVRFHAPTWPTHMKKFHTPDQNAEYDRLRGEYQKIYKPLFPGK